MFYSPYFTFNGTHCLDMNVRLVSFDSDVLNEVGINYKEEVIVGNTNKNIFYYRNRSKPDPITLSIVIVDNNEYAAKWTSKSVRKISEWLLKPYFCEFKSEDMPEIVYYFKCSGINKRLNAYGHGVLDITFQPESTYGLTSLLYFTHMCNDITDIKVDNVSNIGENYFPKLKIVQNSKEYEDIIVINNDVNKNSLIIKGLEYGEEIEIDNQMKSVTSSLNINRFSDINREWMELKYGINNISILGKCSFNMICQFPIIV